MTIFLILYLALPAFVANMMPVVAARYGWMPRLARPVSETWFGRNKQWRGFIVGTLGGGTVALVQFFTYAPHLPTWQTALAFGLIGGFGALFGDSAKSFIKRRIGVAPGKPFIPFDWIDYILGFCLFTYPLYAWSLYETLVLLVFVSIANPLVNLVGYALGIKNTAW